jgi:tRNA (guanine-N7-)-methyltransferase
MSTKTENGDTEAPGPGGPVHARRIRSFVTRAGRITKAQQAALHELWPRYGIEFANGLLDLDAEFRRSAPRTVEIGFGNGAALLELAQCQPGRDYLGIEVHKAGVGHCLLGIEAKALSNVRLSSHDAVDVLAAQIPNSSLDEILIFFPDPWHKKRHHKRRLVQPKFADLLARKLAAGGRLHLATDWEDYAAHMIEVLDACPSLRNLAGKGGFVERPASRPVTRFEARGHRLGHGVWDLAYRNDQSPA